MPLCPAPTTRRSAPSIFGTLPNFPTPTLAADGTTLRFVYNCDPDGDKRQIPATINTVGATACACAADGEEVVDGICVPACANDEIRMGGICAPGAVADRCRNAGWPLLQAEGACGILLTLSGGAPADRCNLVGSAAPAAPQCDRVFGATPDDFPSPTLAADGTTLRFVYNCDPDGKTGFVPATANTVAATACRCPDGQALLDNGSCVPDEIMADARSCLAAGRAVDPAQGGSCAVAVTLSDGDLFDKCYFSGPKAPQCADVFGEDPAFPVADVTVVYNCDPAGRTGLVPATINTVEAVECSCPGGREAVAGFCAFACPADQTRVNGVCVPDEIKTAAQKCADATREFSVSDGGSCVVPVRPANGQDFDRCYFSRDFTPQCRDVFGESLAFPADLSAPAVYNCDLSGQTGLLPATINTVAATECSCPAGEEPVGGVCASSDVVDLCASAGWVLSAGEGSCGIPVTRPGVEDFDGCYLTGSADPQCADVFGSTVNYFPAPAVDAGGATLRFVFNCDPDGSKGQIPASANTIGATECSCVVAEQNIVGGACRCPDGQGLLAGGTCGACARDGEGVLSDGTCGVCPSGHAINNGVCIASAVVDLCENAGWTSSLSGGGACEIPLTLSGGASPDQCYFAGLAQPQCSDVFGATVNYFPAPTVAASGATLRFVYGCDPDGSKGFLPATTNTVKATECACPVGEEPVGGACVSSAIAVEARRCLDAGWAFSEADGGSCAVPLAPAGAPGSKRCYFTSFAQPQCSDVFGAVVNYFPAPTVVAGGATLRFVYDCDPGGTKGFLPATLNTVGATACVCPAGETSVGGACVSDEIAVGAQNCLNANREFSDSDGGSCVVPVRPADGQDFDRCHFSRDFKPQCRDVFGESLAFPADLSAPAVYNCDPSGQTGFLPATINTVAATECACPAGDRPVGGLCVPADIADGAQKCVEANLELSAAEGGSCALPIKLSGGGLFDKCHFSDSASPQCEEVFGAQLAFPDNPGVTIIYNCDPNGGKGLIPATININGETECSCVIAEQSVVGGACQCPAGQGLINGACGACARDGEGVLSDGTCGVCPSGHAINNGVCIASAVVDLCENAGWASSLSGGGACGIPLTLSGDAAYDQCYFAGFATPQCADVFGATVNYFPRPTLAADGATLRFVYGCDRDGGKGLLPATINTVAATECACPDGYKIVDGVCVPGGVASEARSCRSAGWEFFEDDGGGCAVPLAPADGPNVDRCYFTDSARPQCADVFGPTINYFPRPTLAADGATLRFVYDCDPDGSKGFLPATVNTIGATACACPSGKTLVDGACVSAEIAVGAQNCLNANREFSDSDGGSCVVPVRPADGQDFDRCYFSRDFKPQCRDVFGESLAFPADLSAPVVYNCDPSDETGLLPATVNTVAATACSCPDGQMLAGGYCVPNAVVARCESAGWNLSVADGSCGVPSALAGRAASDRCYFSGSVSPRCEEVFGATVNYFPSPILAADGATLNFVYNCDPDGGRGGAIPAAANTVSATECRCGNLSYPYRDGACVPKTGNFEPLSDELLCGVFGGTARWNAIGGGMCSGMDKNNTFCMLDSASAFPCRGLFKHLRTCNLQFNRQALNPFLCGDDCGEEMEAFGARCRRP